MDPALEALWREVLDRWDEDAVHTAFLEYCHYSDRLVDDAAHYRKITSDRDKAKAAEKRLAAISLLALAKLDSARSARSTRPRASRRSWTLVAAMVVLTMLAVVLLQLTWRME